MSKTKLVKCSCENKFQDEKYGSKIRVANETTKKEGGRWRCSVCRKES